MDDLNRPDAEILPYPLQRALVRHVAAAAEAAHRPDLLPMWAGQSATLSQATDPAALLQSLVTEISAIADPVAAWTAARPARLKKPSPERHNQ
jgi:nitronate monooxygenase